MEKHGHRIDMESLSGEAGAAKPSAAGKASGGAKIALVIGLFALAGVIYAFNPFGERAARVSTTGVSMGGGDAGGVAPVSGQPVGSEAGTEGQGPESEVVLPRGGTTHPHVPDPDAQDPGDEPDTNPPAPPGGGE